MKHNYTDTQLQAASLSQLRPIAEAGEVVTTNDGGPAFPCETYGLRNGKETTIPTNGMTLRDYFAGQALNGYLASWSDDSDPIFFEPCHTAKTSYAYADAMLAAREVKP